MPPKKKKDVAIDVDDGENNCFILFFSIEANQPLIKHCQLN